MTVYTLLGKTWFSLWFVDCFICHDGSVFSFLGLWTGPHIMSQFIAVITIQVLGLEPIDLHQVDLLDLGCLDLQLGFILLQNVENGPSGVASPSEFIEF